MGPSQKKKKVSRDKGGKKGKRDLPGGTAGKNLHGTVPNRKLR